MQPLRVGLSSSLGSVGMSSPPADWIAPASSWTRAVVARWRHQPQSQVRLKRRSRQDVSPCPGRCYKEGEGRHNSSHNVGNRGSRESGSHRNRDTALMAAVAVGVPTGRGAGLVEGQRLRPPPLSPEGRILEQGEWRVGEEEG